MQAEADLDDDYAPTTPTRVGWLWRILMLAVIAMVVAGTAAWLERERIAGNLIDAALADAGLEARYDIVSIGTQRQTIANLVVGDPAAPDLTVERVDVDVVYTWGVPEIGRVQLVRPRLYGSYRDGAFSLGSLDPLLYAESDTPPGLPALDILIFDGRALIESDFGPIGAKLDGAGRLDDGFAGRIAATARDIGSEGCRADKATLFGTVAIREGRIGFNGPVRLRSVACAGSVLESADIAGRFQLTEDFTAVEGEVELAVNRLASGAFALTGLSGTADIAWRFDGELSLRHDLAGAGLASPYADVARVSAAGTWRSDADFSRSEWEARLGAEEIDLDREALALGDARTAAEGTFAGTLLAKLEAGLDRALRGGDASADLTVRVNDGAVRAIIPEARLRSASGETVLALSRISYAGATPESAQRMTGNFLTGGAGLPRINGRIEQVGGGDTALRMSMAEYRQNTDALAIPRMEVRQYRQGRVTFNGMLQAEGAIPGGAVRGLTLPLEGAWSQAGGLSLGQKCTPIKLRALTYYDLALAGREVTLCPVEGGAIATYRDALRFAARTKDILLTGELAQTPARIAASSAVIRYPGAFRIDGIDTVIGADDNAVRLTATGIEGTLGDSVSGRFEGGTAMIDAVPLDLADLSGTWSFAQGALNIGEGAFTVSERPGPDSGPFARFEPLIAKGATLTLADNAIRAFADLNHPGSGELVTRVTLRHDLSTASGRADISVPGITFSPRLQPEDLSQLAKGVIAFADGTVRGIGQVSWTSDSLDSSGRFSTDAFDFAAAFGPVRGVSGTVTFTDLLGLTTAPSQSLRIGAINTGIEVLDGQVAYAVTGGTLITVEDARWPFMGGELILRPVKLDFGGGRGQSYIFEIVGLDAATFVAQMELTNLGASGTFDGTIPILFDADGNGTIEGGILISRAPGGNVAYVGDLTYEDLGTMGNFAFQTLRSLDYNQMLIELNGSLAGEILTSFKIDGVRQGEGTSRNFITRQLAQIPIRFNVNVYSENFFIFSKVVRGFFDPTIFDQENVREQLGIGRLTPIRPTPDPAAQPAPDPKPNPSENEGRDEPPVQPPESDR